MPEFYRDMVGEHYLALLGRGISQKNAMLRTRQKFKGRDGKMIGRATVYRYAARVRKAMARSAR